MTLSEAHEWIVAGKDVKLTLTYDHLFELEVIFVAANCDNELFIPKAELLIAGSMRHEFNWLEMGDK